jgi:hypothetical protein
MSSGVVASAQVVNPLPSIGPPAQIMGAREGRAAAGGQGIIHGTAVDINSSPLPHATVRLRNLQTNQIEQISSANQIGEFSFGTEPEIPYVVEIADRAGRIVAVGDVVVVHAGEVAGATVTIPTRFPAQAGMFRETAGSVVSAAVSTGITASSAIHSPTPSSPER